MPNLYLNGQPYDLVHDDLLPKGKRSMVNVSRDSNGSDPKLLRKATWTIATPIGRSRAYEGEPLGCDYVENLEHRFDNLLTATPLRTAVTLTGSDPADVSNGPNSPGTLASATGIGTVAWTDAANAAAADNAYATANTGATAGTTTRWLRLTNFGFAVPANAIITGILVEVQRHTSGTGNIRDEAVQLVVAGAGSGENKATNTNWASADPGTYVSYGGQGDLWGHSALTEAQVEATTFGVQISAKTFSSGVAGTTANIDHVRITVYYLRDNFRAADEQGGFLFAHRGTLSTQVRLIDMAVDNTVNHGTGAVKSAQQWRGQGYLAMGNELRVQTRNAIGPAATYAGVTSTSPAQPVFAKALGRGNDRIWLGQGSGTSYTENFASWFQDAFVTRGAEFQVGDPGVPVTGVGFNGPYTLLGFEDGLFSFTESGKPVRMLKQLQNYRHPLNCRQIVEVWGWSYVSTVLGIFAVKMPQGIENPAGPESIRGFEGPVRGRCTALWTDNQRFYAAYLNESGNTYILVGEFGPQTAGTGFPDWYVFRYIASTECDCITGTAQNRVTPTIVVGEGTNMAWYRQGRFARWIDDPQALFDVGGGTWYGSTLMIEPGLIAFPRYFTFLVEDVDANNYWQFAVGVDESTSYTNIGSALTQSGLARVRPVSGTAPIAAASFRRIKPQLVLTAASNTTPAKVRGLLTMIYDVRAEHVEEYTFQVKLGIGERALDTLSRLRTLESISTTSPITWREPENTTSDLYGFVVGVGPTYDVGPNAVQATEVKIVAWTVA